MSTRSRKDAPAPARRERRAFWCGGPETETPTPGGKGSLKEGIWGLCMYNVCVIKSESNSDVSGAHARHNNTHPL